ncbi:FGGY-family carbohydrate kinase [Marinivivus vitaminiproducens]|uniref:FGGY-family carbohydrate kinase n=1 Tax=Marinivivus vitaminiproducens TaxID=3035935 RepID=UPI00279F8E0A|nr:FGGY family carbohydrate kinase [Geminicoccaceae bacterium SCSIO 64248]
MTAIAVLDIGKTNVKLSVTDRQGAVLETLSTANPSLPGPPYRHHDVAGLEDWVLNGLAELGGRHAIEAIVPCAHGSGGVLVDRDGPALPMVDYEGEIPAGIDAAYRSAAGDFRERGSSIMLGAAHIARQMLWQETCWPEAFKRATHILPLPQYWAWRLSGVPAADVTSLAAQSHLWSPAERRPARIVDERGWTRLMPPVTPPWTALGPLRPEIAARTGLRPGTRVLCGVHDSTVNLYRYQAAGLSDMTVVSTGTWLVAITDRPDTADKTERSGVVWNADVEGRPLSGVLMMAGREFSAIAGKDDGEIEAVDLARVERLIAQGTMALPSFGEDDGFFPDSAGRGRIEGPTPADARERRALAVLYTALLADVALDHLPRASQVVLDGSFVREPVFAALVAAMRAEPTFTNDHYYGTATGAALLAGHEARTEPVPIALARACPAEPAGLDAYRKAWRSRADQRRKP